MLLTIEVARTETPTSVEVAICFDDDGLDELVRLLSRLKGRRDHEHLMTPSWGGAELTESKQGGADYTIVNHLRLVKI
ncbi:MAG: immunity protein 32 [Acidobacteria bacterium]|nr:immunity protein 32 [Acidobacteriota bacterium]